eukprot:CAMPEP_0201476764 /NCGR_PEP_ID=MMETSP0151_2-20130828/1904_1 /ASSEMBLY_ACC=CAM_ASM_000257 /TAXON_ID=200890 /ORGANISM="Paramoeba atlantica, Strain 621/1 / CCAP 1560/9" /LENGTH=199 /DNA_ID=CAMNT_0047857241 /DNA_START=409 /DNA_END=1005 /DNA_ORIENTATION=-
MIDFAMVRFPLIYSQVVTFAVWSYFLMAIFGFAQFLVHWPDPNSEGTNHANVVDTYFPIFTIISFIVIVGWLKVAQHMLDPYGDGEDDVRFDLHWVLHRNVEVATAMVVHGVDSHPPMEMTQPLTGTLSEQKTEPNPQKQQLRRRKNFSLSESEEEKGRREREGESGGESSSGRSDSMSDLGDVEMKVVNGSQKGISYW